MTIDYSQNTDYRAEVKHNVCNSAGGVESRRSYDLIHEKNEIHDRTNDCHTHTSHMYPAGVRMVAHGIDTGWYYVHRCGVPSSAQNLMIHRHSPAGGFLHITTRTQLFRSCFG